MVNPEVIYKKLISLLDNCHVEYKLFTHRPALTYDELAVIQAEVGFLGTEMKCLVMKADENFIVYITLQGQRVDYQVIAERVGGKKVRLATPEELLEHFGATPGCAYPFGFDASYDIYVDPTIYKEEWLLFSPVVPTQTVQARGADLKKAFDALENHISEVSNFNQPVA